MYAIMSDKTGKIYDVIMDFWEALEAYDGPNGIKADEGEPLILINLNTVHDDEVQRERLLANPVFVESLKPHLIRLGYAS